VKVALVSTCAVAVPPAGYGGTELFVAVLAKALGARGHEVTVYATGDSRPAAELRYRFPTAVWPPNYDAEIEHAAYAWHDIRKRGADVVHLNSADALIPASANARPLVTLHHARIKHLAAIYARHPAAQLVAVSRRQATLHADLGPMPVVYHGLDPADYPIGPGGGGYAAFLGRIGPDKAPHLAIDAARKAGLPLQLGGPHLPGLPYYDAYFERCMTPRLRGAEPAVRWLGELERAAKLSFLQAAEVLLVPMAWEEPFGTAMIEAMMSGTPVLAFSLGSAPELVDEGITGFVVAGVDEMAAAIPKARSLDRAKCREQAVKRFTAIRMAAQYETLYDSARGRRGPSSNTQMGMAR
jgi:glycosyltransferase involved in cell wall biosynthesis